MSDIPLEEILSNSDNIYESVVVMFRRARQVTDEQKREIEKEMGVTANVDNRDSEDFDEVEIDREALLREYKKYPKPSQVAMNEMAEGGLTYRYKDRENKENRNTEDEEKSAS